MRVRKLWMTGSILVLGLALLAGCRSDPEADLPELGAYEPMAEDGPPMPFDECVTRAWEIVSVMEREWHEALRDLVKARYPDIAEAAELGLQSQAAIMQQREAQFGHVLAQHPDLIQTGSDAVRFREFLWVEADTAEVRESDPGYADLEALVLESRRKYTEHPDYDRVREAIGYYLSKTGRYGEMVDRRERRESEIEQILARCEELVTTAVDGSDEGTGSRS